MNVSDVTVKAKPQVDDDHAASRCRKCGGTGVYVMEVRNGRIWSATGTTCWSCGGKGWVVRYKPGRKPKAASMVPHYDASGKVTHWGPAA